MDKLVEIFCDVDDFCKVFIPQWELQLLADGTRKRQRKGRMTPSEIKSIIILFHMSHHRDFKNYYIGYISNFYKNDYPNLLSYTRFLEVMPSVLIPLCSYFTILKERLQVLDLLTRRVLRSVITYVPQDIKISRE
jgi:hypothetical protein